ncbi:hypothetical protein ACG3SK_27595 [Pseudomonas aeruginosa]
MTLSSVLAAFTVSATLVLSKAFCLGEAATIAPCGVWVGLALLAAMVLPLKNLTQSKAWGDTACYN